MCPRLRGPCGFYRRLDASVNVSSLFFVPAHGFRFSFIHPRQNNVLYFFVTIAGIIGIVFSTIRSTRTFRVTLLPLPSDRRCKAVYIRFPDHLHTERLDRRANTNTAGKELLGPQVVDTITGLCNTLLAQRGWFRRSDSRSRAVFGILLRLIMFFYVSYPLAVIRLLGLLPQAKHY